MKPQGCLATFAVSAATLAERKGFEPLWGCPQTVFERNGLKKIRFHDLRHSCASLMLANDISMKEIQEWLGHSNISTTANIYAHVDSESKRESAKIIDKVLSSEEAV